MTMTADRLETDTWQLADARLASRLLIGSAMYPSPRVMQEAIAASGTGVVTVSLRRQGAARAEDGRAFWEYLSELDLRVLPNTAGCFSVAEAVTTAQMAREVFGTPWVKLEVLGDEQSLQPDPFGLVEAARELVSQGFEVFPYCTDDLVLCDRLLDAGCRILMPWAAPIGTGKGIVNPYALASLRARFPDIPMIVDAGLGAPSHAARAMEMGFDGVLLNTAIARARDPVAMAAAFGRAVEGGRLGYLGGLMPEQDMASPSTPDIGKPFWQSA